MSDSLDVFILSPDSAFIHLCSGLLTRAPRYLGTINVIGISTVDEIAPKSSVSGSHVVVLALKDPAWIELTIQELFEQVGSMAVLGVLEQSDDWVRVHESLTISTLESIQDILDLDTLTPLSFARACLLAERRLLVGISKQHTDDSFRRLALAHSEAIIVLDADNRIIFLNHSAEAMFARSAEDLLGSQFGYAVAIGEPRELRIPGEYGDIIAEMRVTPIAWYDQQAMVVTLHNITDRVLAEQSMIQTEHILREQAGLLDITPNALIVRDISGSIVYWNHGAEVLYGISASDALGSHLRSLIRDQSQSMTPEDIEFNVLEKGFWSGELKQKVLTNPERGEVVVESSWTLVRNDDGEMKSILINNNDITDKKKLEAQFYRSQRLESIGTLAGGIAHDLNNVLSPILLGVEVLKRSITDTQSVKLLSLIESSTKRGADIVRQVLTFARGAEGQRVHFDAKHLLREVEKMVRETFPKSILIHTTIQKDLWQVNGDPTQLHQVLMNLCINARDAVLAFTGDGTISITADNVLLDEVSASNHLNAKAGEYVRLSVADTGTGIEPEILEKIFEPFFTTKEPGKGTGLGLSTALSIVEGHGGFFDVQTSIGGGTTFRVFMPAVAVTHSAKRKSTNEMSTTNDTTGETSVGEKRVVLVVDDEEIIRDLVKQSLEQRGFSVLTAHNGVQAVVAYRQHYQVISAVILDMVMPLMDGASVIRVLREVNPRVAIIAVVSPLDGDVIRPVASKLAGSLVKPFTTDELVATLEMCFTK